MKLHHALLLSFSLCASLGAQEMDSFLLPIFSPVPTHGAHGSEWITEAQIHNTGDANATVENLGGGCTFEPCGPGGIPAKTTLPIFFIRGLFVDDAVPGALLYVPSGDAGLLRFQLRVRDISRSEFGWGTWLPVVQESTAPRGTVHLLSVPREAGYRQMLRVYSFGNLGRVHVRFFGTTAEMFAHPGPDPLLAEFSLDLIRNRESDPGYAQFTAFDELPGDFPLIRLEISPEGEFKVWGMVSITNNATQEVTGIFPN